MGKDPFKTLTSFNNPGIMLTPEGIYPITQERFDELKRKGLEPYNLTVNGISYKGYLTDSNGLIWGCKP